MANHKQAKKRYTQSIKRNLRNKHFSSTLKNTVKSFKLTLETENVEDIKTALKEVVATIDKTESKGIITSNRASRLVSRLSKHTHNRTSELLENSIPSTEAEV
ncbi:MAG: 30S ribosomal protein S20 [Pseudomonadota bacterium]